VLVGGESNIRKQLPNLLTHFERLLLAESGHSELTNSRVSVAIDDTARITYDRPIIRREEY
jgi:hypothetical protein